MRFPLRKVPFEEPRSRRTESFPSRSIWLCLRETSRSASRTDAVVLRPSTLLSPSGYSVIPAPSPLRISRGADAMCGAEGRGGMTPSLSEDARTRGALQDGQRPATGSLSWKHTGQTDTSSPGSRRYHRGRALRDFDLLVTAPCEDQAAPRRPRRARGLPLRGGTGRSGVGLPDGQAEGVHAPGAGAHLEGIRRAPPRHLRLRAEGQAGPDRADRRRAGRCARRVRGRAERRSASEADRPDRATAHLGEHLRQPIRGDRARPLRRGGGAGAGERSGGAARRRGELLRLAALRVPQARTGLPRSPPAARPLGSRAQGLPRHSQRARSQRRRQGESILARPLGRVAAARPARCRQALCAGAAAAARGSEGFQRSLPAHRPPRADAGALRAAELHLERGRQALPSRAGAGLRSDRTALPGGGLAASPRPSPRPARRVVVHAVSAARAGVDLRGRSRAHFRPRRAARARTGAARSASSRYAPALLQARGASAVRGPRQAAGERAARRRAEPRAEEGEPVVHPPAGRVRDARRPALALVRHRLQAVGAARGPHMGTSARGSSAGPRTEAPRRAATGEDGLPRAAAEDEGSAGREPRCSEEISDRCIARTLSPRLPDQHFWGKKESSMLKGVVVACACALAVPVQARAAPVRGADSGANPEAFPQQTTEVETRRSAGSVILTDTIGGAALGALAGGGVAAWHRYVDNTGWGDWQRNVLIGAGIGAGVGLILGVASAASSADRTFTGPIADQRQTGFNSPIPVYGARY